MVRHRNPISGITAYKDAFAATAGYDNQIILWNASGKSPVACSNHDHLANQDTFSLFERLENQVACLRTFSETELVRLGESERTGLAMRLSVGLLALQGDPSKPSMIEIQGARAAVCVPRDSLLSASTERKP